MAEFNLSVKSKDISTWDWYATFLQFMLFICIRMAVCYAVKMVLQKLSSLLDQIILYATVVGCIIYVNCAPCRLQGCKNRPAPFPGWMSYKATKPGLVLFYILAYLYCCLLVLVILVKLSLLAK